MSKSTGRGAAATAVVTVAVAAAARVAVAVVKLVMVRINLVNVLMNHRANDEAAADDVVVMMMMMMMMVMMMMMWLEMRSHFWFQPFQFHRLSIAHYLHIIYTEPHRACNHLYEGMFAFQRSCFTKEL